MVKIFLYGESGVGCNQLSRVATHNEFISLCEATYVWSFRTMVLDLQGKKYEIKYNAILLLCQKIKDHFKCCISISIYGSYYTGLQLEGSDIDISVQLLPNANGKYSNNVNLKSPSELINELNDYLSNFKEFTWII